MSDGRIDRVSDDRIDRVPADRIDRVPADRIDRVSDGRIDRVSERHDRVYDRLDRVLDPCSCLTERPLSIVELGLVETVVVDGGTVTVELVPTSPVCLYMAQIVEEVEAEVSRLDGVDEVVVEQTIDVLWRPERMDADLLREKEERAAARLSEVSPGSITRP